MDWLSSLLNTTLAAPLTAMLLGVLVAIDGCTLATAITAIGYIARELSSRRRVFLYGLLYALGRTVSYYGLSLLLLPLLREEQELDLVRGLLGKYGTLAIGGLFFLVGVIMLVSKWIRLPLPTLTKRAEGLMRHRGLGAFLMGMLFALAVCPAIGAIFFGALLPLAASSDWGLWLPLFFALSTALPIILVAWIVAFSLNRVGRFYQRMQRVQQGLNVAMALLFLLAGGQMLFEGVETILG